MKLLCIGNRVARCLFWTLVFMLAVLADGNAATEEKFELLQYGTKTYQNVTVTTKTKDYIFITHTAGMTTLRVTNLPPEVLQKLGYEQFGKHLASAKAVAASSAPSASITPSAWAKKLASPEGSNLRGVDQQLRNSRVGAFLANRVPTAAPVSLLLAAGAIMLVLYFFVCCCCKLMVEKAGAEPGVMVWVPMLQLVPLVRAAGMPLWWVLGFFVPILNVLVSAIWCWKISEIRGKSRWFTLLLLLPVTGFFAFIYLAFSNSGRADKEDRRVEVMTLETA